MDTTKWYEDNKKRLLGDSLIDYLESVGVRMTRREIDDLFARPGPMPSEAEVDTILKELCSAGRLVRAGMVKSAPDRDDGVYGLPEGQAGSAVRRCDRRYSIARGAPSSDLLRRSAPEIMEGGDGWDAPRKSNK